MDRASPPHPPEGPKTGTFSCVVDAPARFHLEALRWFATLHLVAGVDPSDMVVHAVDGCTSDVLDHLRERGVTVQEVAAFDDRSPHCNKIAGAVSLASEARRGPTILTDSDVVILEDPRSLPVPPKSVASTPVDRPHPSRDVLRKVFDEAGLAHPPTWQVGKEPNKSTFAGNGNGGLYLVSDGVLPVVVAAWDRWARWLLERRELLEQWTLNVDQVAMVMAIASEGLGAHRLEGRWNFAIHERNALRRSPAPPAVIHYHHEVNAKGLLVRTGIRAVDRQIDLANSAITEVWHDAFPNATFWEWRYATNPNLGSGSGSRGKPLAEKRELLSALVDIFHPESVLDVGCGDGEATKDLPLPRYVGIDPSAEAVRRAREGRPDGDYRVGTLEDHQVEAELTLCLDVLIHIADPALYRSTIKALLASTTRALLISGYEQPPAVDSPMVHFHEPLSATVRELAPEAELYPIRKIHGMETFIVLRKPAGVHPRDYGPATLSQVVDRSPNPLRLINLRVAAWTTTGFFPDHAPRLWEYPAVADLILSRVREGSRVVDVGAGINPLVPYLTANGYVVDTVDPSERIRTLPAEPDWTGWGFLDYSAVGMAHCSWNCRLDQLPPGETFDAAYSISMIEHLPAQARRGLLHEIAQRVTRGGLVVLTVDLVRNRRLLWNQSQGQTVESTRAHGTLRDVVREAKEVGLEATGVQVVRDWGDVPVDIGVLILSRRVRPSTAGRLFIAASAGASRSVAWARERAQSALARS